MIDIFFAKTLPQQTAKLVDKFQNEPPFFLKDFYLSGGTALSLQIGHRESEDLDFFTSEKFNPETLQQSLLKYGSLDQTEISTGTLNTFINGTKLQFLEYPYKLIKPTVNYGSIFLSSVEDIACTKLQTIGMRGSKKDFIDLYFLLDRYSLTELFLLMDKKYQLINYNKTHIMKSLIYFEDANDQPMPRMHNPVSWDQVKEGVVNAVKDTKFR